MLENVSSTQDDNDRMQYRTMPAPVTPDTVHNYNVLVDESSALSRMAM